MTVAEKKKKSFYKKWWFWVIIIFAFIGIIGSSGTDNNNTATPVTNTKAIEYKSVTVDELVKELKDNAAAAKDNYNGKYLEIKGRLDVIDSDLKYIGIYSLNDTFSFDNVHCNIKNTEQKEIVKTLKTGDIINVKGKITNVGEVLGYYLDITEISK